MEARTRDGRVIVEAYAEWDDPDAFRVFLIPADENGEPDIDKAEPMESAYTDDLGRSVTEHRLFMAAMYANPKDFVGPADREIGWPKEAPAQRAAKAVNAELKRIAKGEPPPDPQSVSLGLQIASIMRGGKRR